MKKFLLSLILALFMFALGANTIFAQEKIIVPNVSGIPHDVAAHLLRIAGLRPIVKFDPQRSLIITQQEPKPGMLVVTGTDVIISTGTVSQSAVQSAPSAEPETSYLTAIPQEDRTRSVSIQAIPSSQPTTQQRASQVTGAPQWYPKKFLGQVQDVQVQSFLRKRTLSSGSSNILGATPYLQQSSRPVVLRNARGWQQGWFVPGWEPGNTTVQAVNPPSLWSSIQGIGQSTIQAQPSDTTSTAGEVVIVPPVLQLQQRDAAAALQMAGLVVGSVFSVQDSQTRSGVVTQQSPKAHSVVSRGTAVQLWVVY